MQDKILIAVDSGKYSTKALMKYRNQLYTVMFRTKMQKVERLGVDIQQGSYHLCFKGNEYLVGDMVSEDHNDFNLEKTSPVHQLSIYTAIAELLTKAKISPLNKTEIQLAINAPINTYKDSNQKLKLQEMVQHQKKPITISINDNFQSFTIQNLTIAFEGIGTVYDDIKEYKNRNTIIVDIGGLNTTFCTFRGIQPLLNTMTVSNLGINVLKGKIGKSLNERFGVNVSADDLEQIVQNGYFSHRGLIHEESRTLIELHKKEFLQQIVQFAQSREYTFNNADIQFVGGGSYTLEKFIKEEFPFSRIIVNPQFANVRSFLKILEVKNE
ncbi:ParM/StbA family protein [Schinkia azotoformans]|uniref:ParM/StbA family protein n=1 Tax=Schinkia azotoformans TaxID=1454 RepID=UPI002DBA9590|nr:ParM/StbA family protein [Schinkia azotoformans]MEC1759885.1 ParM/StbA family protein [Schinkia azotoformans]